MYRFCDGPVLIYFSKWSGQNDNYEAFFNGGCVWENSRWLPAIGAPIPQGFTDPSAPPSAPPTVQDDTNQQGERDEGR
jgi:hypothetical protein